MLEAKGIRIKDFPAGEALWRVDWMGDIHQNQAVQSEHLITVFLTKLNCSSDTPFNPLNSNCIDSGSRRVAEIGVGLLPLVWIGSVWQDGRRINKGLKYDDRTFAVDTSIVKTITFSGTIDPFGNNRIIPAHQYPLGSKAWTSVQDAPLFAIPYLGDPYGLLIPVIEVIRFYYIHSSFSARAIFYGEYDRLFSDPECNLAIPLPPVKLTLRWGAKHEDAWMLARYIASELFKRRANKVHSLVTLQKLVKDRPVLPESFFPFDGNTNLKVEGIKIKGDDGKLRFLVTRLRNCTHPMPYSEVTIRIPEKSSNPTEQEELRPILYKSWPIGFDIYSLPAKHDQEPDKDMAIFYLEENEARFSALKGKKLKKEKIPPKPKEHVRKPIDSDEEKNGLETSEGTHGKSDAIRTEIRQDLVPDDDRAPMTLTNFVNALAYLRTQGLTVETIQIGEDKSEFKGETISFFEKLGKSNRQWSVVHIKPPKKRGIIVAKVSNLEGCAYVLEIERDPSRIGESYSVLVISSPRHTEISTTELESFKSDCQTHKGWPPVSNTSRQFNRTFTPHRKPEKTATDIQKNIDDPVDPNMGKRIYDALARVGLVKISK